MNFALIAAMDEARGIGKGGTLPWRLPKDLAYFNKVTMGTGKNAVIMGRATWDSLPAAHRPLPGRVNIVVSRNAELVLPAAVRRASSLEEALTIAKNAHAEKAFVIGGAKVFAEAISHPECSELYITEVHGTFACDTFFPKIDPSRFKKTASSEMHEQNGIKFSFVKYALKGTGLAA